MPHRNMVKTWYSHSRNISMSPWLPNIQRRQYMRQGRRCPPYGNKEVLKWGTIRTEGFPFHQFNIRTGCNIIWSKMSITGSKDIYVSLFYKPHEHDEHSMKELWSSVEKIHKTVTYGFLKVLISQTWIGRMSHHQTHADSKICMTISLKTS